MVFQGSEGIILCFFGKKLFRESLGTEFSRENAIALLEQANFDRKHGFRRAKEDPKDAKNASQGPKKSLDLVRGTYSRRLWASPKDQRSLKKAAMLATNCKLQIGDWRLDARGLTRRGYGEFFRFCD